MIWNDYMLTELGDYQAATHSALVTIAVFVLAVTIALLLNLS